MNIYQKYGFKHSTLEKVDNFMKIENIPSKLLYGELVLKPDFTLVIPVYGLGKYLKDTLESIRNQKKSNLNIQIIISDNKEYNEENPYISFLENLKLNNLAYFNSLSTLGQYNNFNRAFMLAQTKYVAMIHDDDLLVDDYFQKIEMLLPMLKEHEDIAMIHGKIQLFNEYDQISTFINIDSKFKLEPILNSGVSLTGISMTGIPSCGFFINKQFFIESGGFNDEFFSSGDAFPAGIMLLNKKKVFQSTELWGYYRVANNSSLKTSICQGFIIQDYLFGEEWMNKGSIFRKMLMSFFRNYRYSKNIEGKIAAFGKFNSDINIKNLDFRKKYKKYYKYGVHHICYALMSRILFLNNKIWCLMHKNISKLEK